MPTDEKPKAGHKLMWWGGAITVAYIVGLAIYAYVSRQSFLALPPNELGDFLAGAFSPLAFFWLVLGFIQQGHELRNSAEALWLQGQELQNSVAQQRELVRVTTDQLNLERDKRRHEEMEAEREARPTLILKQGARAIHKDRCDYTFSVINAGTPCANVRVSIGEKKYAPKAYLKTDEELVLSFSLNEPSTGSIAVNVSYVDRRGNSHEQELLLVADESRGKWGLKIADRNAVTFVERAPEAQQTPAPDTAA